MFDRSRIVRFVSSLIVVFVIHVRNPSGSYSFLVCRIRDVRWLLVVLLGIHWLGTYPVECSAYLCSLVFIASVVVADYVLCPLSRFNSQQHRLDRTK